MKTSFFSKYRIAALLLTALLLLSACGAPTVPAEPTEPHTPCHDPFQPVPTDKAERSDASIASSIASVFESVAPAPAESFVYEDTDGGIRITAYRGEEPKIVIPDRIDGKAVVALGDGLLRDNTALTALAIPESVTEIGTDLLTGCRSIQVLQTPQLGSARDGNGHLSYFFGQTSPLGTGFRVPSTLDTVILLDTVTAIAASAFTDCSRVHWIVLPDTLTSIGAYAFSGCSQLSYVPLPDSLRTIGEYAFENCTALTDVVLPASLQHIGENVFWGCNHLTDLTLPFLGASRDDAGYLGYLFGAETYHWNSSYLPHSLIRVRLTEGNIPNYAFYGCDYLENVTLPDDCAVVGVRAFYGCAALQRITFPDSVATISDMAFAHCTTLAEIEFSENLKALGLQVFMGCTNLVSVTLPDSLASLPASTFADCCNLRTVSLGAALSSVDAMAFHNCVSLTTVTGGSSELQIAGGNSLLQSAR